MFSKQIKIIIFYTSNESTHYKTDEAFIFDRTKLNNYLFDTDFLLYHTSIYLLTHLFMLASHSAEFIPVGRSANSPSIAADSVTEVISLEGTF